MKNFIARVLWMTITITGIMMIAVPQVQVLNYVGIGLLAIGLGVAAEILFKEDK